MSASRPRDDTIVAWHEVPGKRPSKEPSRKVGMIGRTSSQGVSRRNQSAMAFVPEGRCDRSLARSAWDSTTQNSRPVGYDLIRAGVRTDSIIGVTNFNDN